jgi:hypothetical protein
MAHVLPGGVRSRMMELDPFLSEQSKAVPLHSMWRLGGEEYSSYSFLTSALDGGEWSASRPGPALPQGKDPRYPLYRRLGRPQSHRRNSPPERDAPRSGPGSTICELFATGRTARVGFEAQRTLSPGAQITMLCQSGVCNTWRRPQ